MLDPARLRSRDRFVGGELVASKRCYKSRSGADREPKWLRLARLPILACCPSARERKRRPWLLLLRLFRLWPASPARHTRFSIPIARSKSLSS